MTDSSTSIYSIEALYIKKRKGAVLAPPSNNTSLEILLQ